MLTKIQKWGNSQGLRFSKQVLAEAKIDIGDEVEVFVKDGKIIVRQAVKIRGKYKLKDLVAQMLDEYETKEEDWGAPQGKEVW